MDGQISIGLTTLAPMPPGREVPNKNRLRINLCNEGKGNAMDFLRDLWLFMKERKKFWLLPIIVMLVLLGSLIVLTQGSAVAPFIYTLF